jgi:8-oxo-dGTP pyrophosphatase MutT (NUDIX family)
MNEDVLMVPVDRSATWWTTSDVAEYLGLRVGTVSSYRRRSQMPAPDQTLGRTRLWHPQTIIEWQQNRPRAGREIPQDPPKTRDFPRNEESLRWQTHGERTLYDNHWVQLSLVNVEPPGGDRFEHHVVTLLPAAIVAVLDNSGDQVLMMWRHRFPSDIWNWELPGGLVEDGEDPESAAAREVEEETGFRPRTLHHLITFEPIIGMVRSPHHLFVTQGAERVSLPTETTEMQCLEWIPLDDVLPLITSGKIRNSGTLVSLLHLLATR